MMPRAVRLSLLVAMLGLGVVARLPAQVAALSFTNVGSSSFIDSNNRMLGWQFSVTQQVDVLSLGWFDLNDDGLAATHQVGIWDTANSASPLVSVFVPAGTGATLSDHFRYVALGSVLTLQPGNTYRVAGFDPGSNDQHVWDIVLGGYENKEVQGFDHDTRIGLISGGGIGSSASGFSYPTTTVADGRSVLMGPNLLIAAVPEPATTTMFMMLAAGGAVVLVRIRRARQS